MPGRRRVQFPCCICDKVCGVDTIQYTDCNESGCTGSALDSHRSCSGTWCANSCPEV